MFESIFGSTADAALSAGNLVISLFASLTLGGAIYWTYSKTNKITTSSKNFMLTLLLLPTIISMIIMLVGSNVARAFSLAGAFSLVRFRSSPGDPKDIAYVCLVMALGLASGMGYIAYAVLFTVFLCAVLFLLHRLGIGTASRGTRKLKITIPEDMNFSGAFDDVFVKYAEKSDLEQIRTTDLGSLFELAYTVILKSGSNEKEFIDALRCRNGNLNISLTMKADTMSWA